MFNKNVLILYMKKGRCFKLDRNSQGRAQELTIREGMSYFEKICLRGLQHGTFNLI